MNKSLLCAGLALTMLFSGCGGNDGAKGKEEKKPQVAATTSASTKSVAMTHEVLLRGKKVKANYGDQYSDKVTTPQVTHDGRLGASFQAVLPAGFLQRLRPDTKNAEEFEKLVDSGDPYVLKISIEKGSAEAGAKALLGRAPKSNPNAYIEEEDVQVGDTTWKVVSFEGYANKHKLGRDGIYFGDIPGQDARFVVWTFHYPVGDAEMLKMLATFKAEPDALSKSTSYWKARKDREAAEKKVEKEQQEKAKTEKKK